MSANTAIALFFLGGASRDKVSEFADSVLVCHDSTSMFRLVKSIEKFSNVLPGLGDSKSGVYAAVVIRAFAF